MTGDNRIEGKDASHGHRVSTIAEMALLADMAAQATALLKALAKTTATGLMTPEAEIESNKLWQLVARYEAHKQARQAD